MPFQLAHPILTELAVIPAVGVPALAFYVAMLIWGPRGEE